VIRAAAVATALLALFAVRAGAGERPDVIFLLLDTTRADRFGVFGNPRPTTPVLDALAGRGVLFAQHYANSHATRPSLPQLLSGRYYHQSVLREFEPTEAPREYRFSAPDPTAVVLPALLRGSGWVTLGASSHPWVVADSEFGRGFDRLEFVAGDPARGHADASDVVDRGLGLWRARDRTRPAFLYLHFLDMHAPRYLPGSEPRFPVAGYDWRRRFGLDGEPLFGYELRRWSDPDASDYTAQDSAHVSAVYDTRLAYADEQIGRLVAAVSADDPDLRHTLVVVVADHGEELGEDGRRGHWDSLAEPVEHIPWIVAGGGVPAQRDDGMTENVDVVPTLLALLQVALPAHATVDGRAQLDPAGHVCAACAKAAVYHAWEDYRAIRTPRMLLREPIPDSFGARCDGAALLYRMDALHRVRLDTGSARRQRTVARLAARLDRRLDQREAAFLAARYAKPGESFVVRPRFWRLGPEAAVACVPVGPATPRHAFDVDGWLWSGRGVTVLRGASVPALPVTVLAPDGDYRVDAGVVALQRPPWMSGLARWRRRSFLPTTPGAWARLGTFRAERGRLSFALPADVARLNHVVGVRLTPLGASPTAPTAAAPEDPELRQRLKALGYVQ